MKSERYLKLVNLTTGANPNCECERRRIRVGSKIDSLVQIDGRGVMATRGVMARGRSTDEKEE